MVSRRTNEYMGKDGIQQRHYIDRTLEIIQVKGEKVKYIGRNADITSYWKI